MPRPRKRYFVKAAGFTGLLGVIGLLSAWVLTWLAGQGLVTSYVAFLAQALVVLWLILLVVSGGLVIADFSYMTPHHRDLQPYEPPDDEVARVLVYEDSEILVYGRPDQTLRDALLDDWPLDKSLKKDHWYVVDSAGTDVTDKTFLEFDGIVQFRVH